MRRVVSGGPEPARARSSRRRRPSGYNSLITGRIRQGSRRPIVVVLAAQEAAVAAARGREILSVSNIFRAWGKSPVHHAARPPSGSSPPQVAVRPTQISVPPTKGWSIRPKQATPWCRDIGKRASPTSQNMSTHLLLLCRFTPPKNPRDHPVSVRSTHTTECMQECRAKRSVPLSLLAIWSGCDYSYICRSPVRQICNARRSIDQEGSAGVTVVSCSADI